MFAFVLFCLHLFIEKAKQSNFKRMESQEKNQKAAYSIKECMEKFNYSSRNTFYSHLKSGILQLEAHPDRRGFFTADSYNKEIERINK